MENLVNTFSGCKVLVTGHTGFKGSWLCEWLTLLGADVTGFSSGVPTNPSAFEQLCLANRVTNLRGDLRDSAAVERAVNSASPDFVFHLAAQAVVRSGYKRPMETLETNILGTVHLLQALRALEKPCAVIVVTSDKCYENMERDIGYREGDPLGGRDPYSASKACAEILTAAWRSSFFQGHPVRIASARAGNVIGGGDWATDRLLPDAVRALAVGLPVPIRNPHSVRPWQHVLDSLGGYLLLASKLSAGTPGLDVPFNFGPTPDSHRSVRDLIEIFLKYWPGSWTDASDPDAPNEAGKLCLNIDRAKGILGWTPRWDFETALQKCADWYRASLVAPDSMQELTRDQIRAYTA